jgi:hypothetical protein
MNALGAEGAVSLSAFVVASTYGYRRVVELNATSPPVAHFVVGFGVVYVTLSIVAAAAPELGGMMAILIMVGDLLINGTALVKDLSGALGKTTTAVGGTTTTAAAPKTTG